MSQTLPGQWVAFLVAPEGIVTEANLDDYIGVALPGGVATRISVNRAGRGVVRAGLRQVVVDRDLVTSRKPGDLPAFNEQLVATFSAAVQPQRAHTGA